MSSACGVRNTRRMLITREKKRRAACLSWDTFGHDNCAKKEGNSGTSHSNIYAFGNGGGRIILGIDWMMFALFLIHVALACNNLWHWVLVLVIAQIQAGGVYAPSEVQLPICYLLRGQQRLPRAKPLFLLVSPLGLEPRTT
jgi:hypothetical protein